MSRQIALETPGSKFPVAGLKIKECEESEELRDLVQGCFADPRTRVT